MFDSCIDRFVGFYFAVCASEEACVCSHRCAALTIELLALWMIRLWECGRKERMHFKAADLAVVLRLVGGTHVLIGFTEQTKGSCTCQESE